MRGTQGSLKKWSESLNKCEKSGKKAKYVVFCEESEVRCVLWLWSGSREMLWKRWIEYYSPERLSSLKCKLRTSLCFSRKSDLIEYLVRLRLSTSAQKSKFLNNYQIFFKEFDENSLTTFAAWAANKVWIKGTVLSFSALLNSILCTWVMFSFVLHYIFLEVPRISKLERS